MVEKKAEKIPIWLNMKVAVEILTGKLFHIEVANDATVGDLKRQIEAVENLAADRMILYVRIDDAQVLMEEDGASLVDSGVQDGSHIYLLFKPLEGESAHGDVFTMPEHLQG